MNIFEKLLSGGERTLIMGVLNVTPDSFYDGGKYFDVDVACRKAFQLVEEGADVVDVGGESTRPGSDGVSVDIELNRIMPVLKRLEDNVPVPISIDTTKAEVARQALECGVSIVNDVSALRDDPEMIGVVTKYDVPVVVMHMKGYPRDMQENPFYVDVIEEIKEFFTERIKWVVDRGVKKENIVLDPGIGFGKRMEDNLEVLRYLCEFKEFGMPVLVGPSRKSFIGKMLGVEPEDRGYGTAASVAVAVMNGADIVRVHDVKEMKQVVNIVDAIKHGEARRKPPQPNNKKDINR